MKYFSLTSIWLCCLSTLFLFSSFHVTEADPVDDLSFTLGHPAGTEVYSLIPENRVSEILADRLDLFPKALAPRLAQHIIFLCKEYRFDPAFILSLIEVESGFHVKAASKVGALGLMQVMIP